MTSGSVALGATVTVPAPMPLTVIDLPTSASVAAGKVAVIAVALLHSTSEPQAVMAPVAVRDWMVSDDATPASVSPD